MYTKRIIKPSNSKISSENPQVKSKIIVNRTNSNKDNKIQKQVYIHPQSQIHHNNINTNINQSSNNSHTPIPLPQKNYSLNTETVKKLLLSFYPEDKVLFKIGRIFQFKSFQ